MISKNEHKEILKQRLDDFLTAYLYRDELYDNTCDDDARWNCLEDHADKIYELFEDDFFQYKGETYANNH